MNNKSSGIGLGGLIIIGLLVWFFFFRVDYKDVWWKDTEYQRVVYCGTSLHSDCRNGTSYTLPVTHIERSGDIHTVNIKFPNGGYVEAEGECWKDESDLYPGVERYCYVTSVKTGSSGMLETYLITQ